MARRCSYLGPVMAAWLCLAAPVWAQSATAPLKICHEDEDNYPWVVKNGKGASVMLTELAAARTGQRVVFEAMPWRRCLSLVERGQVDGVLAISHTEERARYAVFPMTRGSHPVPDEARRLSLDEYSLYRAVGSSLNWNGKAFSGVTGPIAYQTAFSIVEQLKQWGVQPFDGSKSPEVIFRRVIMGNLQGAAIPTVTGDNLLGHAEFVGKIERVSPPLVVKPYFLAFGKSFYQDNERLVNDLWNAIEQVRKSAEYQAHEAALFAARK